MFVQLPVEAVAAAEGDNEHLINGGWFYRLWHKSGVY